MAGPVVQVRGLNELRRAMKAAGVDMAELREAHAAAAAIVAAAARGSAPRRSGNMAGKIRGNRAIRRATVIVSTPYAGPIHWGWPSRPNPAKGWRGGPIKANPWVSETAQSTESTWLPAYERELDQILDKVGAATP